MTTTTPPATDKPASAGDKPAEKTAADTKALAPMKRFRVELDKMRPHLEMALPKHFPIDRFVRIVITTVRQKPDLLECAWETVFACVMQCAQLGLSTDPFRNEAHLVPFKNGRRKGRKECQVIVDYRGYLKLARNTGEIKSVSARAVYKKDKFEYELGLDERLVHVPSDEEDPGPLVAAYCIFRFKDGGVQWDVMPRRAIERIRDKSKSYMFDRASSPWTQFFDAMAIKTVIRKTQNLVGKSVDQDWRRMERAEELERRHEQGEPTPLQGPIIDVEAVDDDGFPPAGGGDGDASDDGSASGDADAPPAPEPSPPASMAEKKVLAKAAKDMQASEAMVAGWYRNATGVPKLSYDDLTSVEVANALAQLAKMDAEERKNGS